MMLEFTSLLLNIFYVININQGFILLKDLKFKDLFVNLVEVIFNFNASFDFIFFLSFCLEFGVNGI